MRRTLGNLIHNIAEAFHPNRGIFGFGPGGGLGWLGPVTGELAIPELALSTFLGRTAARSFSVWDTSITSPGSKLLNVGTDVTATEFQANLISNGYRIEQTTKDVVVLSRGKSTYSIYQRTSTGKMGAQYIGTSGRIKYSLGLDK